MCPKTTTIPYSVGYTLYLWLCWICQVENWLNNLLTAMINTVRKEMSEAVAGYEEKPRDQWLFDYPAQVALCGTQIWWTVEANAAFTRLEEGFENAMKDYFKKQVCICTRLVTHSESQT